MTPGHQRGLLVLLGLLLAMAASQTTAEEILQTGVLVEFTDDAFKAAVSSAGSESAAAVTTADAAVTPRRPRVARAAVRVPAAANLAKRIVDSAKASRIRIRRYQSYGLVFEGMSVETETPAEADALRGLLRANPKVKKIYPVYMVQLPQYIPPTRAKADMQVQAAGQTPDAASAAPSEPLPSTRLPAAFSSSSNIRAANATAANSAAGKPSQARSGGRGSLHTRAQNNTKNSAVNAVEAPTSSGSRSRAAGAHTGRSTRANSSKGSSGSGANATAAAPKLAVAPSPAGAATPLEQPAAAAANSAADSSADSANSTGRTSPTFSSSSSSSTANGTAATPPSSPPNVLTNNSSSSATGDDDAARPPAAAANTSSGSNSTTSNTATAPTSSPPQLNTTVATNATANTTTSSSPNATASSPQPPAAAAPKPVPVWLRDASNISGIHSIVNLPIGPDGQPIDFLPNMEWAMADLLTGVSELRSNFKLTGKGIKIGIIDTGIDYTHPAFGGCKAINDPPGQCRVIAGKDLVGNEFVSGKDVMKPDDDPRDCHNSTHGTTVAGIAAAGYFPGAEMLGVAPEASLGVYKVFGCRGTAPTSAIIAAVQQAVLDGMDIINLSLSLGPGFPAEPYESVMQRVYDLGIITTKSAGNQGQAAGQGLFWVDAYTGAGSITVASADTSTGVLGQLMASEFSTYGPDANINLLPHLAAPGTNVLTTTTKSITGGYTVMSGTSHATPYMAGGLALLLQLHREESRRGAFQLNRVWESLLANGDMNQSTVLPALISTATPVTSDYDLDSSSAVAKSGSGLVNFASAYFNPIEVSPSYISLPSNLNTSHVVIVTLRNNLDDRGDIGQRSSEGREYTFAVSHRKPPAVAARITNEWGIMPLKLSSGLGAVVTVEPSIVTVPPGGAVNVTLNFTLSESIRRRPWLYSGYIDLWPMTNNVMASRDDDSPEPPEVVSNNKNNNTNNNTNNKRDGGDMPVGQGRSNKGSQLSNATEPVSSNTTSSSDDSDNGSSNGTALGTANSDADIIEIPRGPRRRDQDDRTHFRHESSSNSSSSSSSRSSSNESSSGSSELPQKVAPAAATDSPAGKAAKRSSSNSRSSSSDGASHAAVSTAASRQAAAPAATPAAVWSPKDRWAAPWQFDRRDSPTPNHRPLVIPYQGVSVDYNSLPLVPGQDSYLDPLTPGLCYAPADESENVNYPEYAMDIAYDVNHCKINTADYWELEPISIPLQHLRTRPCDLRITLSPQLPVKRIDLELRSERGELLGMLPSLDTPVFSRAPAYDASVSDTTESPSILAVYSYCLSWKGRYRPAGEPADGQSQSLVSVKVGQTYRLTALLEAPVAVGDADRVTTAPMYRVPLRGSFTVTKLPTGRKSKMMM